MDFSRRLLLLLLGLLFSPFFPPFISFHPSLSLPQFVSPAGPPCLYLSLIFLRSSWPPLPGNFSQPPHPLIFHQGRSAQTNMGCNLFPAFPPTNPPHPVPVCPWHKCICSIPPANRLAGCYQRQGDGDNGFHHIFPLPQIKMGQVTRHTDKNTQASGRAHTLPGFSST